MQRTANENAACLPRICTGSIFVCGPLHHYVLLFSIFGAVGLFRSDMLLIFNMVWPWFSCGTASVCPQFPYRGKSYCPLSRVLHVTLANWQRFGFEFHLRSSPFAYSGFVDISRPAEYFTACYTVLKRPANKVEAAVHDCNLAFSLDSIVSLPR